MSKIQVNDIKPTGAELFDDSENFLNELSQDDLEQVMGGLLMAPDPKKALELYPKLTGKLPPFKTFPINSPFCPVIL